MMKWTTYNKEYKKAIDIFAACMTSLVPPKDIKCSEYTAATRILRSGAIQGPIKLRPYQIGWLDSIHEENTTDYFCQMASQVSKTSMMVSFSLYDLVMRPGAQLNYFQKEDSAIDYSKVHFSSALADNPDLRRYLGFDEGKFLEKNSNNTLLFKQGPGFSVRLLSANTYRNFASYTARMVFGDECARWDVLKEGSPYSLVRNRTVEYSLVGRKHMFFTSPTTLGSDWDKEWSQTDQRKVFVPCPACKELTTLEWENVRWINDDPRTAIMHCNECKAPAFDDPARRLALKTHCEWRPTNKTISTEMAGKYLWRGYVESTYLYNLVTAYLRAKKAEKDGEDNQLQVFMNTAVGLPYQSETTTPKSFFLFDARKSYSEDYGDPKKNFRLVLPESGPVSQDDLIVTTGVDLQQTYAAIHTRAYQRGSLRNWLLDYRIRRININELGREFYNELLKDTWKINGYTRQSEMICVDTGFSTMLVYNSLREMGDHSRLMGIDGRATGPEVGALVYIDINLDGKKLPGKGKIWPINVNLLKQWIYGRLALTWENSLALDPPPGFCFNNSEDEQFYNYLTSEIMRLLPNGKALFTRRGPNEPLDTWAYGFAGAIARGVYASTVIDAEPYVRESEKPIILTPARDIVMAPIFGL